jgi:YCII-related domain
LNVRADHTNREQRRINVAKYLLAYKGGKMADTDAEREAAMARWGAWFGSLGAAVADPGNPFGASAAVGNGAGGGASSGLSGYSIVSADSLAAASQLAEGCPVIEAGGSVEVYEAIPIEM